MPQVFIVCVCVLFFYKYEVYAVKQILNEKKKFDYRIELANAA